MNLNKNIFFVIAFLIYLSSISQELKFTANFILNDAPLKNVQVSVYDMANNKLIESTNSGNASQYKIALETGNNYRIYFSHPKIHKIFCEIISYNMSENDLYNNYYNELDLEFIPLTESVDTSVLSKSPVHRIQYNPTKKKFEDDVPYNQMILSKIFRENEETTEVKKIQIPYNLAGTIFIKTSNNSTPITKKDVVLYKSNQLPYFTKQTNNFGQFFFNKVYLDSAQNLLINLEEKEAIGKTLILADSKKRPIYETKITDTKVSIPLSQNMKKELIDNRFAFFIGGKIYKESDTSVSFLTDEVVYLLNQKGTKIQSTKTNIFGAFIFQDIKPGNVYQIAVRKDAIKKQYKAMLYNNIDEPICEIDSSIGDNQLVCAFRADNNKKFDNLLINESLLRMNVKGKVFNENTNNPVSDLKIYLISEDGKVIDSTITDNYGSFIFAFVPYMKYSFKFYDPNNSIVTSSKILLYSSNDQLVKLLYMIKNNPFVFNLLDYEQKRLTDIYIEDPWLNITTLKLKNKNIPTISEHIYFETNQYKITPAGEKTLQKILTVLTSNPQLSIEIRAYTDSRADDKYNKELSQKRADAVKNYLIKKGIDANRISAFGFGEEKILNHCKNGVPCTDDEHAVNRRVEFDVKVKDK